MDERAARWAAVAALALFVAIGAVQSDLPVGARILIAVPAVALAAALTREAGWRLFAGTVLLGAGVAALCTSSASNVGWFGICVLAGWTAVRADLRAAALFTGAAAALFVLEWTVASDDSGWTAWIAGTVFTTVVCAMGRRQRDLIDQLRAAQAGLADRARVEERGRIARELHDVIAHSLTVSLLHVSSARLAVEEDPAEAIAALDEAERLGRQSLAEARQAVGLLRDSSPAAAPLPGGAALPALVDGFRRAGAKIRYSVSGDPSVLGATAGLTLYRVLQEALTNAARHAAGAPVEVRLDVTGVAADLVVDSAGPPASRSPDSAGLDGMRDRAAALGGTVTVGPHGTGWRVAARIPITSAARAAGPA